MTEQAVNDFIGRGVVSDKFREDLMSGRMTRRDIVFVNPDLDSQDINAIVSSMMFAGSFENFAAGLKQYLDLRYRGGRPSGDNLPISV